MHTIYNIGIYLLQFACRLLSLKNEKIKLMVQGQKLTFSKLQSITKEDKIAWFHCASLGEFEQARNLIESFKQEKKEYKILDYINKARNNPKIFYHNYFSNIFDDINLEFKEFIYKNKKSKELKINKELNNIARKHCEDLCENETAGDIGTDDLDIIDRIKNFKKDCYYYGENIIYNINNPLLIVKSMMIDKYSKKKKNRNNLFFDKYKNIGMFLKEHPIYKYCCVFIFSE